MHEFAERQLGVTNCERRARFVLDHGHATGCAVVGAGPVRTLAARGIAGFSQMEGVIAERAPLKRGIDADDVGQAGVYLLSPMASSVTGTILYVDAGYHAMGL